MSEWQPIETAPRDGTNILVKRRDGSIRIVRWHDVWHAWQTVPGYFSSEALGWQPLPVADPADAQK